MSGHSNKTAFIRLLRGAPCVARLDGAALCGAFLTLRGCIHHA